MRLLLVIMREIWVTTAGNRMARTIIRATQRRGASADGFLGGEVEEEEERRLVFDGSLAESSSSIFSGKAPISEYLLQHFQSMPTTVGAMLRTAWREKDSLLNRNLTLEFHLPNSIVHLHKSIVGPTTYVVSCLIPYS